MQFPFLHNQTFLNCYLKKTHAVLTNVPGPFHKITFAGQEVISYKPIIPQPFAGGLGLGILSYNGKVVVTVYTEAYSHSGDFHIKGGPKALADEFSTQFEKLLASAKERQESK